MKMDIIDRIIRCLLRNNKKCSLSKIATTLPDTRPVDRRAAIQKLKTLGVLDTNIVTTKRFFGTGREYKKTVLTLNY